QMIETQVRDDAVDPRVEGTLKTEVADVAISLQEGFLIDVLRVLFGAREMVGKLEHGLVILTHECLKRCAVAALRLAYQIGIVNAARNRRHASPGTGACFPACLGSRCRAERGYVHARCSWLHVYFLQLTARR